MATIEENIVLNAVGGEGAAAQVGMVTKSLQDVENTHDGLKQKFGEKFQHLGLQLFAGEALRANGVGMETRAVVNILGTAMTAMGGAMGSAIGPIMLVVTALAAVGGIIEKVVKHHKDLAEQLEKTNKATDDQLHKTNDVIKSIDDYAKVAGTIPDYLKRWEDSEKSLQAAQVARQIAGDRAQIASLTELMNQEARRQDQMKEEIGDQEKLVASLKSMAIDMGTVNAEVAKLTMMRKAFNDNTIAAAQNKAKIDELIAAVKLLGNTGTDDISKLTQALKDQQEEEKKAAEAAQKAQNAQSKADDEFYKHWSETHKATLSLNEELTKKYYEDIKSMADQAFHGVSNAFASAFVQMAMEGKSFKETLVANFKSLTEQILTDLIRIQIEMAILTAMGGPGAGVVGGIHMAEGGSFVVDKPTLFMAGEAGQPEVATFTPFSKLGTGDTSSPGMGNKSGGGVNIQTININTYEATDADKLGRQLVERIRGMGELNFTRSS